MLTGWKKAIEALKIISQKNTCGSRYMPPKNLGKWGVIFIFVNKCSYCHSLLNQTLQALLMCEDLCTKYDVVKHQKMIN
jgi:hypothetical protein